MSATLMGRSREHTQMIDAIEINYRHVREQRLAELSEIVVLTGPNDSGKTAVFKAVQAAINAFSPKNVAERANIPKIGEFGPATLIFNLNRCLTYPKVPRLRELKARGQVAVSPDAGPMLLFPEATRHLFDGIGVEARRVSRGQIRLYPNELIAPPRHEGTDSDIKELKSAIHDLLLAESNQLSRSFFLWHRRKSDYVSPVNRPAESLDGDISNLATRLYRFRGTTALAEMEEFNKVVDYILPGTGEVMCDFISHNQVTIVVERHGEKIRLEDLGGGVEQAVALALTLVAGPDEGCIFVEEPEAHLHHQAQRRMIKAIDKYRGDRQVFLTTHSPVFINELRGSVVYGVRKEHDAGRTSIQYCFGRTQRQGILDDLGVVPSSILQANCVVWVEGPTELRLIPYWLSLVADELVPHLHYEVVSTGGSLLMYFQAQAEPSGSFSDMRSICAKNFIIADADKSLVDPGKEKGHIARLRSELGDDSVWITCGYEIEWYYPKQALIELFGQDVVDKVYNDEHCFKQPFHKAFEAQGKRGLDREKPLRAKRVIEVSERLGDPRVLWFSGVQGEDLREQLGRLANFIRTAVSAEFGES